MTQNEWQPERKGLRYVVSRVKWSDALGAAYEYLRVEGRVQRFWTKKAAQQCSDVANIKLAAARHSRDEGACVPEETGTLTFCPACEHRSAWPVRYSSTIVPISGAPSFTADNLEGDYCSNCQETSVSMEKLRRNQEKFDAARAKSLGNGGLIGASKV